MELLGLVRDRHGVELYERDGGDGDDGCCGSVL